MVTVASGPARRTLGRAANGPRVLMRVAIGLLLVIVAGFVVIRFVVDLPHIWSGTMPGRVAFERRYAEHPIPAYLHIVPGAVYLFLAPLQLWRRFRESHWTLHRRLGRCLVGTGLFAAATSTVVGLWFPYGGAWEASASVAFGTYLLVALAAAFTYIRRGDAVAHRRWMIRAFSVALAVGTIRVWVGLFQAVGLLAIQDGAGRSWFGVAFWLAFGLHAVGAELYLRVRPDPGAIDLHGRLAS